MGFVYMAVATLGIAGNFLLQKFYQTKFCKNTIAVVFMPLVLAILNFLYFFIFNGFKIEYTSFSFIMAFLYALTTTYNTIIGLIIMKYCSMSYFSLFIMMGGMFLPFWYGVFFSPVKETVTTLKIVGLVLLIAALVMISVNKSKISLKGFLLCLSVFIVNGLVSTISKAHQVYGVQNIFETVSTANFMMYVSIFSFIFSAAIYVFVHIKERKECSDAEPQNEYLQKKKKLDKRALYQFLLVAAMTVVYCTGTICHLMGQSIIDASVIFPVTTGGSIILMSVGGALFFKEKLSAKSIAGVMFALIATVLFAL